jgi:hypothetical protein
MAHRTALLSAWWCRLPLAGKPDLTPRKRHRLTRRSLTQGLEMQTIPPGRLRDPFRNGGGSAMGLYPPLRTSSRLGMDLAFSVY